MIHDIHLVSDKARDGRVPATMASGDSARHPVALGETGHPFNATRWQAEMDDEGLFYRIRALRAAARAQGEQGLLAGVSLLLCMAALAPFVAAVLP